MENNNTGAKIMGILTLGAAAWLVYFFATSGNDTKKVKA
jgi:hypothetical protein